MREFSFDSEILYSQVALFQFGLDNPFNDWSDVHVNQGFTWRDGSVSFGALNGDGNCKIIVRLVNDIVIDDSDIRAIVVPFEVKDGGVEVGSVMETVKIDIPVGNYELLFTIKLVNDVEHYTFSFVESENPMARVLKADDGLNVPVELLMVASPAV